MLRNLPGWQKTTSRLLAWGCLVSVVWAIGQDCAFAQGTVGTAEPADNAGFLGELFRSIFLFDSRGLMETLGKPQYAIPAFLALNAIVFVETGLLLGFFLPGDSLLVITGLICANPKCEWSLPLLLITLSISAIVGDSIGYSIGYQSGPKIFSREKSLFFNKDHLLKAQQFYEKHGGKTIIFARFVPILRTFAPVVAGVGKMEYRQFLFYNVIGGVSWVFSMVLAGYFLPAIVNPILQRLLNNEKFDVTFHIEKVVIIVVLLSVSPYALGWIKSKLGGKARAAKPEPAEPALSAK